MAETVGTRARVKASGGIRSLDQAMAMIDAGADRLGLSATAAVLNGFDDS
jgi:deoxyribose-phosphate aldolase